MRNAKFFKKQEKLLKKEREKLLKELQYVAKKKKTGEKYEPKFLDVGGREDDWAYEVTTFEEYLVLERNLEKTLKGIDDALKKIEKGIYGICENCGKEIGENRLKVVPFATLCMKCGSRRQR